MTELTNEDLLIIYGGINLSGALINSFTRGINAILEVSRSLGTAIRRIYEKKLCTL